MSTGSVKTPESIINEHGCEARTLSVSDQHATILLKELSSTKSLLKLTVDPTHKAILSNDDNINDENQSKKILSYLSSMEFRLSSESGAEYSYYEAGPKTLSVLSSFLYRILTGNFHTEPLFKAELISPASERQIQRAMPAPATHLVQETAQMYNAVTKAFIQNIVDGKSLDWIQNVVSGEKEKERLLLDEVDYILNIDTKWRSHPDPATTERQEWHSHAATKDLYCLVICKDSDITCLRDLRGNHLPMLRSILEKCPPVLESIYGVSADQLRIFCHYQPQFYHFHVHLTRLENEIGCQVERGHLVSDIIQNLEMDGNYYAKRTISYRLRTTDQLYQALMEEKKKQSIR